MQKEAPNSLYTIIHELGGPSFVARQLKVSVSTIHGWIKQGRVPTMQKWLEIKELNKRIKEMLK